MTTPRTAGPLDAVSYYRATATPYAPLPAFIGDHRVDVAVIGAGYTGLSAALALAEQGFKVAVLDQGPVGWGASGRNGGQICTGYSPGMQPLEQRLGRADAQICFDIAEAGKALIHQRVAAHAIQCDLAKGHLICAPKPAHMAMLAHERDDLESYGYKAMTLLSRIELHERVATPLYHGGLLDHGGGHLHPLNYAIGLAQAVIRAGGVIYENSRVKLIKAGPRALIRGETGTLHADHVVVACNAYLGRLVPRLASRIMPVASYVIATAPLGEERASALIRHGEAAADANFVVDYFRLTADHRLIFGGRCSYSGIHPRDIATSMRPRLARVFPQLLTTPIDFAWGGHIAITSNRLPDAGRIDGNIYYAQGYSGQGVALTQIFGQIIAEAIVGQASRLDIFSRIKHASFPGGPVARPALTLGMLYYRIRDLLA